MIKNLSKTYLIAFFEMKLPKNCNQEKVHNPFVYAGLQAYFPWHILYLRPLPIGQMIVLNLDKFDRKKMKEVFTEYPEWIMNVILLEEGKSYIYFGGDGVRQRLERLFGKKCENDNLLILNNFLLRKQIMKKARGFFSIDYQNSIR